MMSLVLLFSSYLVGSIPFGLILGKLCCGVDLREVGSCNIGASNAFRVLGWKVALPVFVLDIAKGLGPVMAAKHLIVPPQTVMNAGLMRDCTVVLCGIAAIMGHNFSPFLRFKGGKGVATSLGVCIGMSWKAGGAGFGIWAVLLAITRYISVSSMVGTAVGSVAIWLDNGRSVPFGIFGVLATVFVIVKHRPNLQRLRAGTEPKLGVKK